MSQWPIGLSTGCFYKTSIFECLTHIRSAGFSIIEVCSFPAHLDYHDANAVDRASQLIRELDLDPYSFHAPFAEHIDITSLDDQVRSHSLDEMIRAAEAAASLGVRYYVIHPGPENSNLPDQQRIARIEHAANALNQVSRRCQQLGIRLVLENMLPHLFFGRTRDVLWILGALETTEVGICLDTGHAYLSGDLQTVAHKLSGHLWMVHASDNHGQRDDHLPPGEGGIAWPTFVSQLSRLHFHGTIILEIAGSSDIPATLTRAGRSRHFLQRLSRTLRDEH
ncbi:sugar phosphate isomerase/epimerase [Roseiconus nitratireducens]|uniref:Sugar phosphate isomerase/epimerase n=1 Tax=Roseiconus nitratireducens TaxID=2605748 RepID=A0A5M6D852_9BACT|nr:sugar phosphate isomerase/epimerase family protein [Roseiconus nitratireducens]KAA5542670.1 sugar phosphate isomerase/epimerase [Roseiconus nitratireducens]